MPAAAGLHYFFRDRSEAEPALPVILLHGAGGMHLYWPPEMRRLAGRQTYALDLPGHGQSTGEGFRTIGEMTRAVLAWMDALSLGRAVVVGHSMGGAVALELALSAPQRVAGLGLVGSGARLRVAPQILQLASDPATAVDAVGLVIAWSFGPAAPPRLVELAAARMAATPPAALLGDFQACNGFDIGGRLAEIGVPTLALCGELDRMTPLRYSQFLAEQIPGATLQVIPEAGHMVMLEQPQAVTAALETFLASKNL